MKRFVFQKSFLIGLILLISVPVQAFDFNFKGSLGQNGHQRYVPPLSSPLFNETPYITTEARPIYIHHEIPNDFVTGGGDIDLFALELRVALTERLGIIATKDGYADINFAGVLPDTDGFANISLGLKYAVYSDPQTDAIISVGAEYEPPSGNISTAGIFLQGGGDGFLDLFVTGAKAYGKLGVQAGAGANIAIDSNHDSSFIHWSAHIDYELFENFFPLIEANGTSTYHDGSRLALGSFEGNDLVNFGSTDSGHVVTMGVGARYKFNSHFQLGAGYEFPVTEREDLFDWRTNFDMVISF
jgi:hypothetical protein